MPFAIHMFSKYRMVFRLSIMLGVNYDWFVTCHSVLVQNKVWFVDTRTSLQV